MVLIPLFALMLLAAALTFVLTATVPALRKSAITAPVAAFAFSPSIGIAAIIAWANSSTAAFLSNQSGFLAVILSVMIIALCCAAASFIAVLICRAVFEFLPALLEKYLNIRPVLLLEVGTAHWR